MCLYRKISARDTQILKNEYLRSKFSCIDPFSIIRDVFIIKKYLERIFFSIDPQNQYTSSHGRV